MAQLSLDTQAIGNTLVLTVDVRQVERAVFGRWRWRLRLAMGLIRLGCWVLRIRHRLEGLDEGPP